MLARLSSLGRSAFWRSSTATHQTTEETGTELGVVAQNPMNAGCVDLEANISAGTPPRRKISPEGTPSEGTSSEETSPEGTPPERALSERSSSERSSSEEEISSEARHVLQPMSLIQDFENENVPDVEELVVAGVLHERINERFVNNHELRLIKELPPLSQLLEYTTFITPEGVYQLAIENKDNECRYFTHFMNADEFTQAFGDTLLIRARGITDEAGLLIHDDSMTLKQLNQLEQVLLNKQGHELFGRSVNASTYIIAVNTIVNLFFKDKAQFPPVPEALSARLLKYTREHAVENTVASLRLVTQTNLLFMYATQVYFLYAPPSSGDDYEFRVEHEPIEIDTVLVGAALSMLVLYANSTNRSAILIGMERIRKIEQSVIGMVSNLNNYGPSVGLTVANIEALFLPTIILGIAVGCYAPLGQKVDNIASCSLPKFVIDNALAALTVASFISLGMVGPINDWGYLYANTLSAYLQLMQDVELARNIALALTIAFFLMRYLRNPLLLQSLGRYAGNAMNSTGMVLLDYYSLASPINAAFSTYYGPFSKDEIIVPTIYRIIDTGVLLSAFLLTFPTTPNIVSYSEKKNEYKSPRTLQMEKLFKPVGQTLKMVSHRCLSGCGIPSGDETVVSTAPTTLNGNM